MERAKQVISRLRALRKERNLTSADDMVAYLEGGDGLGFLLEQSAFICRLAGVTSIERGMAPESAVRDRVAGVDLGGEKAVA